jgi:hypothetical protein
MFTVSLSGVNKTQVETATKATLAEHFGVNASAVTVTATESRRLSEARNLEGSWSIAYSFTVPTSQAAEVEKKVTATKTNSDAMNTVFKDQLVKAGVPKTKVDAMQAIAGFTSEKTVNKAPAPAPAPAPEPTANPSVRHFLSIGITTIAIMSLIRGRC